MLSTALVLVDKEGLEALSMRRLGQELQRDPMNLYYGDWNRGPFAEEAPIMMFVARVR